MKRFIYTLIFFVILGIAWVKYLEYDKKRFIESLPPLLDTSQNISNLQVESVETTPVPPMQDEIIPDTDNPQVESVETTPVPLMQDEIIPDTDSFAEEHFASKDNKLSKEEAEDSDSSSEDSQRFTQEQSEKKARRVLLSERLQNTYADREMEIPIEALGELIGEDLLNRRGKPIRARMFFFRTREQAAEFDKLLRSVNE